MSGLNRERWNALCRCAASISSEWFERIAKLYSEPHRHYHNSRHILDCLSEFDSARHLAADPLAVEMAIWFHDAVYDPRASDNEERSADLARKFVSETGEGDESAIVQLVLATKNHDGSLHPDATLIVDVDLSIFGQPGERFWRYEEQIRREYEWVPENVFREKRAEILEKFLSRPRIFGTEFFFSKYEAQTRTNLQASIQRLRDW